jgi:hypothetical protein
MAKSRAQLINYVLKKLNALGAGELASSEDSTDVTDILDAAFAYLRRAERINIPDQDNIPDEVFIPLSLYVASEAAALFGTASIDGEPIAAARQRALMSMQILYSTPYTGAIQQVESF